MDPAVLITVLLGAASSGVIADVERRVLGRRRRTRERRRGGAGPFTVAWWSTIAVGLVAAVVVFVTDAPSQAAMDRGEYRDFFGTSAQITAALIIALAIEASRPADAAEDVAAYRLEACVSVALGALAALCGLIPGLPDAIYSAALATIPPAVVGGLVGVVAVAAGHRRTSRTDMGAAQRRQPVAAATPRAEDGI